jgi:hypothetical protein
VGERNRQMHGAGWTVFFEAGGSKRAAAGKRGRAAGPGALA